MKKWLMVILIILLLSFNSFAVVGEIRYEGEWTYEGLSPSLLTAYKALHYVPTDVLKISTGSLRGTTGVTYENFDPHNGTFWAWIKLDSAGNAGQLRYLFDAYSDASNRISIYISATNNLVLDVIGTGTTQTASTSISTIKAQTWTHIACTWSKNIDVNGTNNLYVYINGAGAGGAIAPTILASSPATFSVGSDYNGRNCLSGLMAWKLTRYWMASTDVTNDYNSGNGSVGFFCVTPHTVALGLTSESITGISAHHAGKAVSAIVDGATEDTLTTSAGSDTVFADNDRVIVSAGNGYNSNLIGNTFVDGTPSSTSVLVDDGVGADTGTVEKIGVNIYYNGIYLANGGDILDVGTSDFNISAWVKTTSSVTSNQAIIYKRNTSNTNLVGYGMYIASGTGYVTGHVCDGSASRIVITGNTNIADNRWHHITFTADRNGNGQIYVDGIANGSAVSLAAQQLTLNNSIEFLIGTHTLGAGYIGYMLGSIIDAKIYIGGLWIPTEILYQATHPFDYSASAGTLTDYWVCTEGSGTTITGAVNNLTLSNVLAWNQSAFLSRNLITDGNMEQ